MSNMELERCIKELRSRPLLLLCRTPQGREQVMTVAECVASGAVYIRLVCDDLDQLLAAELGERKDPILQKRGGDKAYPPLFR